MRIHLASPSSGPGWTRLLALACLLLIAPHLPSAARADSRASGFSVSRAINIAEWFTWPRYLADGYGIAWPPYKSFPRAPSDAELKALKAAGFDTVRLPVDPAPFIVFEGRRREAVYGMIFDAIERIEAAGLRVIVDIHPNSQHKRWGQNAVAAGPDAPAFRAVAAVVGEMAQRISPARSATVALELLNEPRLKCKGADQAQWQRMAKQLVQSARSANPVLALVVSGACISSVDGLLALDPSAFHDRNVFYTFHFYEPFSFSHQGAQFIPWPDKYLDGVPWPASARPISEPLRLISERVASVPKLDAAAREQAVRGAQHNLRRFYAGHHGAQTIRDRFAQLRDWAKRHRIPPNRILNGEFGVIRRAPSAPGALCPDRLRWLRDVREASEANGFAWAYFNYSGPFSLVQGEEERHLDPGVLASLGLTSHCSIEEPARRQSEARRSAAAGRSCCAGD